MRTLTLQSKTARSLSYDDQATIFEFAEENGLELLDALAATNTRYDDLVYRIGETRQWDGASPRTLTDFGRPDNGIPLVSFFTGCGGIDLGFETVGFKHTAAFEIDERFCKTLRRNRPDWQVFGPPRFEGDVANVEETISHLENLVGGDFDGVFVGGPPCQPFSVAASQRYPKEGGKYKRIGFDHEIEGGLLSAYARIIRHFKPTCFIIENVPGLRELDGGRQLGQTMEQLARSGYVIEEPLVVNAADFGVPQSRRRLFVVGTRNGNRFQFPRTSTKLVGCGAVLPRVQDPLENTETRIHKLDSVRRYSQLDYGQRDYLGRVNRLDPSVPAKTVIAGGISGGGRSHLHPEIPRTLSVRECARLQTFPDDFVFVGTTGRQFTQVGNAVPPVLAAQIAEAVADSAFGVRRGGVGFTRLMSGVPDDL